MSVRQQLLNLMRSRRGVRSAALGGNNGVGTLGDYGRAKKKRYTTYAL